MALKKILMHKLFLSLNISVFFVYFLCTNCTSPGRGHPLFPRNSPLKIETLSTSPPTAPPPSCWKFGRQFNAFRTVEGGEVLVINWNQRNREILVDLLSLKITECFIYFCFLFFILNFSARITASKEKLQNWNCCDAIQFFVFCFEV